jgi:hypothetical protein
MRHAAIGVTYSRSMRIRTANTKMTNDLLVSVGSKKQIYKHLVQTPAVRFPTFWS